MLYYNEQKNFLTSYLVRRWNLCAKVGSLQGVIGKSFKGQE
jgi:hypothetical protein